MEEDKMIKVGIYLPVYGGWFRNSSVEEEKPPSYNYIKKVALQAEEIGIDSLWIPDHLLNPIKGEQAPSMEAYTLSVAIAEATEKIIISHTTLCEAFRYPAVLAKYAAAMNDISDGRFWLSLGAGWFKREYEAYGLPFFEHDERVDRAREAMLIIRRLWEENNVTFKGKYYQITDGIVEPKPDPKPPLWYAGMSEASRNLVAEEAEGWLMGASNLDKAQKNIADMNERLKEKGRSTIEFAIPALTFIKDTDEAAKEYAEWISGGNKDVFERTLDTGLLGKPETIAQKIKQYENIGTNHIIFQLSPTLRELKEVKKVLEILKES